MIAQPWPVADASVLAPVLEHEELRTVLRDLLQTHASHDDVRRAAGLPEGWSPKLWSLLNEEMEIGSLAVPEERGGQGYGVAVLAVVLEEAGRALLPEPLLLSSVLGVRAALAAPAGALPDELVQGLMAGTLVATVAPGVQSDPSRLDRVPLGAAADLVVATVGPLGRETIHLVDLRAEGAAYSLPARDPRPHPPAGPDRPPRRAGPSGRRSRRGGRAPHRALDPATDRAWRRSTSA